MTLQEAIDLLKKSYEAFGELDAREVREGINGPTSEAIATILNAVVKGELN